MLRKVEKTEETVGIGESYAVLASEAMRTVVVTALAVREAGINEGTGELQGGAVGDKYQVPSISQSQEGGGPARMCKDEQEAGKGGRERGRWGDARAGVDPLGFLSCRF